MKRTYSIQYFKGFVAMFWLFLGSSLAHAQTFHAHTFGGVNFSQVDGDHIAGYNKGGLNFGIGIWHKLKNEHRVGFDLSYAQKGSKLVNSPDAVVPQIFVIKSAYVEMPLWYSIPMTFLEELELEGGLGIGVNVAGTIDDGPRVSDAEFNKIEVAFNLGGTYWLSDNFGLRLRHSLSLNRIGGNYDNPSRPLSPIRIGMYNRLYSLSVVYGL